MGGSQPKYGGDTYGPWFTHFYRSFERASAIIAQGCQSASALHELLWCIEEGYQAQILTKNLEAPLKKNYMLFTETGNGFPVH